MFANSPGQMYNNFINVLFFYVELTGGISPSFYNLPI